MRIKRPLCLLLGVLLLVPCLSHAEENYDHTRSIQLSLIHPIQMFPHSYDIDTFRFNLIYGSNMNMTGLDLGMVNEIKKDFKGVQVGLINLDERSCDGVAIGVLYNNAEESMHGFQLGIVNRTGSLQGLQIGIININGDEPYKGFIPFINASF